MGQSGAVGGGVRAGGLVASVGLRGDAAVGVVDAILEAGAEEVSAEEVADLYGAEGDIVVREDAAVGVEGLIAGEVEAREENAASGRLLVR